MLDIWGVDLFIWLSQGISPRIQVSLESKIIEWDLDINTKIQLQNLMESSQKKTEGIYLKSIIERFSPEVYYII